jgi:DNA-binding transcriptional MerR regulator
MRKPLTQITFEFSNAQDGQQPAELDAPGVKVKLKSLKDGATVKKASTRGRRSLKDIGLAADLIQIPDDEVLFQKQYYSIGEVATMFRENQSLIRYWETEFDILQPRKNRKGDRFFRPIDVKNLVLIYDLLRRRKFTIEGAKDYLKKNKKAEEKFAAIQALEKIKAFLLQLKANL